MENIQSATWADSLMFTSFGVRIGVRVNQHALGKELQALMPPGAEASTSSAADKLYSIVINPAGEPHRDAALSSLYEDSQAVAENCDPALVFKFLETRIRRTIAEQAPERVFIHAGVVEYRARAIVIPGPSLSGKSTLVSELIRRGATYYSDECAVLDEYGRVHPFAKPLSLRHPGSFDAVAYDVEAFGAAIGVKSVPIGMVVATHYCAGASWRPRRLSAGHGALELLAHCIAARREPRRVMATLKAALANAHILKGARGEASELAQLLLDRAANLSTSTDARPAKINR